MPKERSGSQCFLLLPSQGVVGDVFFHFLLKINSPSEQLHEAHFRNFPLRRIVSGYRGLLLKNPSPLRVANRFKFFC